MMDATPRFLNGVFDFEGRGLGRPAELDPALAYTVPSDKRTQLIYLRAGNSLDELVYLVLTKNGAPMRYFPIGAKAVTHVPLAVVERVPLRADVAAVVVDPRLVGRGAAVEVLVVPDRRPHRQA